MFRHTRVMLLFIAAPALAVPPASGTGAGTGKVSMQDMHFSSKTDAVAKCGTSPVTAAADGGFTCSMPSTDHAINEKHLGNQTRPASKPQ